MEYPRGTLNEAARLGLLTYSYHLFLQWQNIKLPGQAFQVKFRQCLRDVEGVEGISSSFMLWLLTVGAVSILDMKIDVWLQEALRRHACNCKVGSWKEMQDRLRSFMWVRLLDKQQGRKINDSFT